MKKKLLVSVLAAGLVLPVGAASAENVAKNYEGPSSENVDTDKPAEFDEAFNSLKEQKAKDVLAKNPGVKVEDKDGKVLQEAKPGLVKKAPMAKKVAGKALPKTSAVK